MLHLLEGTAVIKGRGEAGLGGPQGTKVVALQGAPALRQAAQAWLRFWPALLMSSVCVGILIAYAASILSARERQLESAQDATTNLARTLADHAEATLQLADLTLMELTDRLEMGGTNRASLEAIHTYFGEMLPASGRLQDAMVFDAQGRFVVGAKSTYTSMSGATEALAWHRENITDGVHVERPVKDWVAAGWSILLSRRLNKPDGSFGGVAMVAIDLDYFGSVYHALRLGRQGAIALTSASGQLLVRSREGGAVIGQDVSNASFFRRYAEAGPVGTLTATSPLDGVTRMGSFRAVASYPLVVFVGVALDDVLEGWWRDSASNGAVIGILVLCTALLGVRLGRLVRSHRHAAAAAQASERMYRLLAVNGTDVIVQLGSDLRRRYVSPASQDVLGYAPEILIGRKFQDTVHPDDWGRVTSLMAQLRVAGEPRTITFRFRRPDATYLSVEASVRRLGEAEGYVSSLRDVSARVAAEAKLQEVNFKLQRLVMLDGLTGIANRRCLDKFLEREFRRASRDEQPLALLMIDADRFKSFNDTYGHQAGDECLRAIAGAVQLRMRRAADLAARFGGEEFVVMLPHTDASGASGLAELIRTGVEGLAIPHAGSPTRIMTVSIGVAVIHPGRDAATVAALIAAADRALYAAKDAGRNCIKHADPLRPLTEPIRREPMAELDV